MLQKYVRADGAVDYAGIHDNPAALRQFLAQAAKVSPETDPDLFPTRPHRLAYWTNVYNAAVLDSYASTYPEERKRLEDATGRYVFFLRLTHKVGGRDRSLDDIKRNSIRAERDPRVYFAMAGPCVSCPSPPPRALTAVNLDEQLDAAVRRYLHDPAVMRVALTGAIEMPVLFDWYAEDFGGLAGILRFIAKYRPDVQDSLTRARWRPTYTRWDWAPNDRPQ